jgi:hypothetical protein
MNQYKRVFHELYDRALKDSADYAEKNMMNSILMPYEAKDPMYSYAIKQASVDGFFAEFGVHQGVSINKIARLINNKKIYGFDSFVGLKEDWRGGEFPKGEFSTNGVLPKVLENVELVSGYFDESLPNWLEDNKGVFSFINIDCDTYESTYTVLNLLGNKRIVSGTMILFDEYFGYPNWREHEYKAWQDFVKEHKLSYEYKAINQMQVLVRIL